MADCEYGILVSAYHDGQLDPERSRQVESHLAACPACAAELEGLRRLSKALAGWQAPEMPEEVLGRLHEAVTGEVVAAERGVLRLARALSGVAAAVMIAGTLWLMGSRGTDAKPLSPADDGTWRTVAVTPPPTTMPNDEVASAERDFAQLMVDGLSK